MTDIPQKSRNSPNRAEARQLALEVNQFSGPLPHPQILAQYELALPGSADRIIRMAEENGRHRRQMEELVVSKSFAEARVGQALAAFISIAAMGITGWLVYSGHRIEGTILGGATLALIITAILKVRTFPVDLVSEEAGPETVSVQENKKARP